MSLLRIAGFLIGKHSCVRDERISLPFFLQTQLQQITVQEHLFGEFTLAPLTIDLCTSPTETFPFTYHFSYVPIPIIHTANYDLAFGSGSGTFFWLRLWIRLLFFLKIWREMGSEVKIVILHVEILLYH